jgi:glycerol-3-phosphate O-acyltransferase
MHPSGDTGFDIPAMKTDYTDFDEARKEQPLPEWLQKVLGGTLHYYSCIVPRKLSRPTQAILKGFYAGIRVGKVQRAVLEQIPDDAVLIFVNKTKSKFEYLFYHTYCSQKGCAVPEIGFDYRIFLWQPISRVFRTVVAHLYHLFKYRSLMNPFRNGYIEQELAAGRSGFLSMVEKGEFYRRFVKSKVDPIQHLIEVQKKIERPIYLVPVLMFFSKDPIRSNPSLIDILFGPEGKPGKIRRLITLFRKPGKVFVEISDPVNLKAFVQEASGRSRGVEYQSLYLRRNLLRQINRHRQSITGPVLKSPEELKESILTGERMQEFLQKQTEIRDVSLMQLRKEADGYLEEIAAKYSPGLVKTASVVVEYITRTMFDGVSVNSEDIRFVKDAYRKGPLILIPCHKSHIDYLILSYVLYHNDMTCPHIAAGKNLSFWPMGPLFRRGGAFFIRRSFRGAKLYSKVFTEYLYKLLEEGFNIEFFIEGTRSRTGKLILPKLGFLSMLLDAFKNGACEDMNVVPIYIGYDRVLEESAYVHEMEGGQKEPENLLQLLKARRFLKKRYGRIYIRFHQPLSLNRLLQDQGSSLAAMSPKDKNAFCRNLGFRVINAINKTTVVTAHGLCACALLNSPRQRFTFEHISELVDDYMRFLQTQNVELADTLQIDPQHAVENAFEAYLQRKFIETVAREKRDTITETEYAVRVNQRINLEYYKNNCVAFFIPAAYTAMEILNLDAFQFSTADIHSGYRSMQHLFKYEFAYDVDISAERYVRKTIKAFIDEAILIPHQTLPDTYNVTAAGFRKLKLFAGFLKTYFESYLIVLNYFLLAPEDGPSGKDRIKKIESLGRRMFKRGEIERMEALSRIGYANGVDFYTSQGVRNSEDRDAIVKYMEAIQRCLDHLD